MTKLDIVVYGASGFTGQLVVRYLLSSPTAAKATWGVAGRSQGKLEAALKGAGAPADTRIIIADSADPEAVVAMVKQTKVVLSLVRPCYRRSKHKQEAEEAPPVTGGSLHEIWRRARQGVLSEWGALL